MLFVESFPGDLKEYSDLSHVNWKQKFQQDLHTNMLNIDLPRAIEAGDLDEIYRIFGQLDYNKIQRPDGMPKNLFNELYFNDKLRYLANSIQTSDQELRDEILGKLYIERLEFQFAPKVDPLQAAQELYDMSLLRYIYELNEALNKRNCPAKLTQKAAGVKRLNVKGDEGLQCTHLSRPIFFKKVSWSDLNFKKRRLV